MWTLSEEGWPADPGQKPLLPDDGEARVKTARSAPLTALVMFLVLLAVGCGGAAVEGGGTTAPAAGFPVEVAGTVIPAAPQRIVSASASHTEILYALGAGGRVVATDQFSDFPAEAAATPKLDAFNLGVESVAAFDPDLVILSFDPGDLQAGLAALGIPTLLFGPPLGLEDLYGQMRALGAASGLGAETEGLIGQIAADVERLGASVPAQQAGLTYYYELDPTLYSVTSQTFVGSLFSLLGMENIADAADAAGTGYPQLSAEYILANDPDFIFLADVECCGQSAETVAARPGWDRLGAVAGGRVIALDDDVASRWGPRLVDLLAAVVSAVSAEAGAG
ncbi:MAG: ABC transporter substrate-binding protein [Acidimicrobiia bacterium]|nr:ABC transporter substrate-binding protein [Acidimicrobiia bacterium]